MAENEPTVNVPVTMTPEQYVAVKRDADWEGCTVAVYLVRRATGQVRRGC